MGDRSAKPPRSSRALQNADGRHRRQACEVIGIGKIEHPEPDRRAEPDGPPFRRCIDCRIGFLPHDIVGFREIAGIVGKICAQQQRADPAQGDVAACTDIELELRSVWKPVAGDVAGYRRKGIDGVLSVIRAGRIGKAFVPRFQQLRPEASTSVSLAQPRVELQLQPIDFRRGGVGRGRADRRDRGDLDIGIIIIEEVRIRPEAPRAIDIFQSGLEIVEPFPARKRDSAESGGSSRRSGSRGSPRR